MMERIRGTTSTGFVFDLPGEVLDNMELVDALAELETDPTQMSAVLRLLLGDQKRALYDHVRTPDGRVPLAALNQEVTEIFGVAQAGKN